MGNGLTKRDWQNAIDVQDACNLSGVVHSLADVMPRIRQEPDCTGTDYVNSHPIVVLYVSKLASLSRQDCFCDKAIERFGEAYETVKAKIANSAKEQASNGIS